MIDPIDILKSDCAEAFAENDRLRALNAELLEALKTIRGAHWLLIKSTGVDPDVQPSIIKASAAIAKASADNGTVSE